MLHGCCRPVLTCQRCDATWTRLFGLDPWQCRAATSIPAARSSSSRWRPSSEIRSFACHLYFSANVVMQMIAIDQGCCNHWSSVQTHRLTDCRLCNRPTDPLPTSRPPTGCLPTDPGFAIRGPTDSGFRGSGDGDIWDCRFGVGDWGFGILHRRIARRMIPWVKLFTVGFLG